MLIQTIIYEHSMPLEWSTYIYIQEFMQRVNNGSFSPALLPTRYLFLHLPIGVRTDVASACYNAYYTMCRPLLVGPACGGVSCVMFKKPNILNRKCLFSAVRHRAAECVFEYMCDEMYPHIPPPNTSATHHRIHNGMTTLISH